MAQEDIDKVLDTLKSGNKFDYLKCSGDPVLLKFFDKNNSKCPSLQSQSSPRSRFHHL